MQFVIDRDVLRRAEYGRELYFDYESCSLSEEKPDIYSVKFVYIPETQAMRAFIAAQNDRRLLREFCDIDDERLRTYFRVRFDDDGINSSHWYEFEQRYYLDAVIRWCEDNGISYRNDIQEEK